MYDPGPLCDCGHPKNVHAMNLSTHSCEGHCYQWTTSAKSFGEDRTRLACMCPKFRKAPDAY